MAETKWTPGPWSADGHLVAAGAERVAIAVASPSNDRYYDNARLIAAAPELAEVVSDVARWIDGLPDDLRLGSIMPEKLRAALAKARGEG